MSYNVDNTTNKIFNTLNSIIHDVTPEQGLCYNPESGCFKSNSSLTSLYNSFTGNSSLSSQSLEGLNDLISNLNHVSSSDNDFEQLKDRLSEAIPKLKQIDESCSTQKDYKNIKNIFNNFYVINDTWDRLSEEHFTDLSIDFQDVINAMDSNEFNNFIQNIYTDSRFDLKKIDEEILCDNIKTVIKRLSEKQEFTKNDNHIEHKPELIKWITACASQINNPKVLKVLLTLGHILLEKDKNTSVEKDNKIVTIKISHYLIDQFIKTKQYEKIILCCDAWKRIGLKSFQESLHTAAHYMKNNETIRNYFKSIFLNCIENEDNFECFDKDIIGIFVELSSVLELSHHIYITRWFLINNKELFALYLSNLYSKKKYNVAEISCVACKYYSIDSFQLALTIASQYVEESKVNEYLLNLFRSKDVDLAIFKENNYYALQRLQDYLNDDEKIKAINWLIQLPKSQEQQPQALSYLIDKMFSEQNYKIGIELCERVEKQNEDLFKKMLRYLSDSIDRNERIKDYFLNFLNPTNVKLETFNEENFYALTQLSHFLNKEQNLCVVNWFISNSKTDDLYKYIVYLFDRREYDRALECCQFTQETFNNDAFKKMLHIAVKYIKHDNTIKNYFINLVTSTINSDNSKIKFDFFAEQDLDLFTQLLPYFDFEQRFEITKWLIDLYSVHPWESASKQFCVYLASLVSNKTYLETLVCCRYCELLKLDNLIKKMLPIAADHIDNNDIKQYLLGFIDLNNEKNTNLSIFEEQDFYTLKQLAPFLDVRQNMFVVSYLINKSKSKTLVSYVETLFEKGIYNLLIDCINICKELNKPLFEEISPIALKYIHVKEIRDYFLSLIRVMKLPFETFNRNRYYALQKLGPHLNKDENIKIIEWFTTNDKQEILMNYINELLSQQKYECALACCNKCRELNKALFDRLLAIVVDYSNEEEIRNYLFNEIGDFRTIISWMHYSIQAPNLSLSNKKVILHYFYDLARLKSPNDELIRNLIDVIEIGQKVDWSKVEEPELKNKIIDRTGFNPEIVNRFDLTHWDNFINNLIKQ